MIDVRRLRDHMTDHEVGGQFCMADGPCPIGTMQDAERAIAALLALLPTDNRIVVRIDSYDGRDTEVIALAEGPDGVWVNRPNYAIADIVTGEIDDYGYRSREDAEAALRAFREAVHG